MSIRATLFGVAAIATLLPNLSSGQSIAGTLIASDAGVPVAGARVWLTTTRGAMIDTARSDAGGRFHVKADRPGRYVLNVRRLGFFAETTDPIRLADGEVRTDTVFVLGARVLKPVEVVVNREISFRFGVNIKALSSSNVITPEEIDKIRPFASTLEDVLRWNHPPSLTITRTPSGGTCFQLRQRGCAPVYLDGMFVGTDGWFPTSEIESVVVIPGNEAFIRFGSSRGVIAVFTNIWAGRQ
ncbi:MAG: carboxypeptidase regulatory-like domain-containing protein [Gemmatimonadaceae bacterium]